MFDFCSSSRVNRTQVISVVVLFSFIDLLFFPRLMNPIAIPMSLPLVMFALVFTRFDRKETVNFLIFSSMVVASVLYSAHAFPSFVNDNIKRGVQLLTFFAYFKLAYDSNYNESIYRNIFRFFFLSVFLLSVLYLNSPKDVVEIISRYYPESIYIQEENLINLRFSYIFQDPNGAAYLYVMMIISYLLLENKSSFKYLALVFFLFSILLTQSRGALLGFFISMSLIFCFDRKILPKYYYIIFFLMMSLIVYYISASELIGKVIDLLLSRSEKESELGGGRLDKYIYFLYSVELYPFGDGYNLMKNGDIFRPHSDFIRLGLSYGIFSILYFFYYSWPKVKLQYYLFVSFIFCFMINSALDEYRLTGVYFILLGLVYKNSKNRAVYK